MVALAAGAGGPPTAYFQDPLQIAGIAMSGIALALVALGLVRARRARLSKAFLLDSHGTPLKELVLDRRCSLTLKEATGKLPPERPEAEVNVSGYRVRSVPAGNLRLLLASRGRITPDHVHYAKFLMFSAEDRFDGAVVAEDSEPATSKALTGQGEGGVAPGPASAGATPAPLAQSAAQITNREQGLASERDLRQLEEQLRSEASGLERERTRIQAWSKDLEAREEALEHAASDAESRAAAVSAREAAFAAKERERADEERRSSAGPAPAADPAAMAETQGRREADAAELGEQRRNLEVDKQQVTRDRKFLQRRVLDLLAREEAVREQELSAEAEAAKLAASRQELEAARAELQSEKAERPQFDLDEAKRDIEKRIKILQEKALDLLQREEKLRQRDEEDRPHETKPQGKTDRQ